MLRVYKEMARKKKYRTFNQLSSKEKEYALADFQSFTEEDNDMEAAEYYYNNCSPTGEGGPIYFNTHGEPIYDENASCYN